MSVNWFWFQFHKRNKEESTGMLLAQSLPMWLLMQQAKGKVWKDPLRSLLWHHHIAFPQSDSKETKCHQPLICQNNSCQSYLPIYEQSEQIFFKKTITNPSGQVPCWQITRVITSLKHAVLMQGLAFPTLPTWDCEGQLWPLLLPPEGNNPHGPASWILLVDSFT